MMEQTHYQYDNPAPSLLKHSQEGTNEKYKSGRRH
jgi:hypothetical protein